MRKIKLKRVNKAAIISSALLLIPITHSYAATDSVIEGPYIISNSITVSAPDSYGPDTYSVIKSDGTDANVVADSGTHITITNDNTDTAGSKKWIYGAAAFNGGSVRLDQATIEGHFWAGLSAEGGNVTVGDNLYINIFQPDGTLQSYGIRVNRYASGAANVTVGDYAYIRSTGDGIWIDNLTGNVTIGDYLTIDNGNTANTNAISILNGGTATIGDYATLNNTDNGVLAHNGASVTLGNYATINTSFKGDMDFPLAGLYAVNGNIVTGSDLLLTSDGDGLYASGKGASIKVGDGAIIKSGMTYDDGSEYMAVVRASDYGTIDLKGATILMDSSTSTAAAAEAMSGGTVTGNGVYHISGDIRAITSNVSSGVQEIMPGNVNLAMQPGSVFTGKTTLLGSNIGQASVIDLSLLGSTWNVAGTSELTNLINTNSIVDMTADAKQFSTLTIQNLSGIDGRFVLDIDGTKVNQNDKLYVANTFIGTQILALQEINGRDGDTTLGKDAVGTILASVNDTTGTFTAADGEGTLYWKRYTLDTETGNSEGYSTDWYLKAVDYIDPEERPTTTVDSAVASRAAAYYMWRDNDQLMKRLGDLRHEETPTNGFWFRSLGSSFGRSDNFGFNSKYNQYQLGYDTLLESNSLKKRYGGIAFSYSDGDTNYQNGYGDNTEWALSLYHTEIGNKGHYLDLIFKLGWLSNDFTSFDASGQKITGDFDNKGVSFSVEYGRKKQLSSAWYIEPQTQLTLGYLTGDTYTTSNQVRIHQDGIRSAVGRVGFNVGRDINKDINVYAKLNLFHEFGGISGIQMSNSEGMTVSLEPDYGDTWIEYGIGADIRFDATSRIYFDVTKSMGGGSFGRKWQWNAGVRWAF